jgi:hypothetical protein
MSTAYRDRVALVGAVKMRNEEASPRNLRGRDDDPHQGREAQVWVAVEPGLPVFLALTVLRTVHLGRPRLPLADSQAPEKVGPCRRGVVAAIAMVTMGRLCTSSEKSCPRVGE